MGEKKYLFLGIAILIAAVLLVVFFPTETRRVKKQFRSLAKWISKESGETKVTMALKIRNIGNIFAPTCQLDIPAEDFSGTYSAKEIAQNAAVARSHFSEVSLKLYDLEIDFVADDTATVTTTAKLTGITTDGDAIDETHELNCRLQKIENAWVFTELEVVEVLER